MLSKINDKKGIAIVRTRLDRVKLGNLGDCKSIGDNVHELRILYAQGFRIYFGLDGEKVVNLLLIYYYYVVELKKHKRKIFFMLM